MKNGLFKVGIEFTLLFFLLMTSTAGATSYTLTVSAQGSGTVTRNPTNSTYPSGVTVTVSATPNAGWYFANWSGDANGSMNPLNVVMNANLVITGNFLAFPTYSLTLATNGQGTIALNPAGGSYLSNTVVTATATPADGWVFTGWTGGTNTSLNPLSLALDANLALTGNFAELPAFDVQPDGVTNAAGSTVNFSSHAVGTAPLFYQWFFSGGSLTNATNATLSLTNVSLGQAGNYWAVATNNYGIATSHVASLTLTNTTGPTNVVNTPDEVSLRAAISIGGWIGLNFSGTITLSNTINITNNVILDGTSVSAIISGGNAVRLFYVVPGATFSATNLTLANGSCIITNGAPGTPADAGAIYNDGGNVTLVSCLLTNNNAQSLIFGGLARGGAIFNNAGTVALFQSAISNNVVIGGGPNNFTLTPTIETALGGAIYNTNGSVTIVGGNVSSNLCEAVSDSFVDINSTGLTMGGAVFQASGSLTIISGTFEGNLALGSPGANVQPSSPAYGGAVAANGGSITIDNSRMFANTAKGGDAGFDGSGASGFGGAIYSAATLTVKNSSFSENQALAGTSINFHAEGSIDGFGGAIYNSGTIALNNCSIYSNYVQGGSLLANFTESTIGFRGFGGGIFNAAQFAATNCTIALNSVVGGNGSGGGSQGTGGDAFGGGAFNSTNASFFAMNVTIASNSCFSPFGTMYTNGFIAGNQIANTNGTLALLNSIIAGTNSNAYGPITDDGFNICSDGSANLNSGASYNFTDPQLASLANYGGPTLCMALLSDSPAIDTADSSDFPATDQRGFVRPVGDGPDMGAFEYGSYQPGMLLLDITSATNNVVLTYITALPGSYRLQASTNLTTWIDLNTNGPFSTATNISQTISQQGFNNRFFRLLVQ